MTDRTRLPGRREHDSITIVHAGNQFDIGVGRYRDGRVAEVFLTTTKAAKPMGKPCRN